MKIQILIFCFSILVLAACNINNSHPIIDNFPGLYVRHSAHEFGKEFDTLEIIKLENDRFRVHRKWRYERILDGKVQPPEYKQEISTAILDAKIKRIVNADSWEFMDLDTEKGILVDGNTEYNKLK